MRKAIKTKALLLLASWFVIFMHGVIPHMHANHSAIEMHAGEYSDQLNCTHSSSNNYSVNEHGLNLESQHRHNSNVCHFNPNMFSQLDIDYSFIYTPIGSPLFSDLIPDIRVPDLQTRYKKPPLLSSSALRAPPLA